MTREAFIRKWLANPQKQYNEQCRDEMRDDLDLVIEAALRQPLVSGSLPDDKRILTEAILVARKVDSDVGLLPSNQDIKMFCLGAKWMRDWAEGNDR